METNWKLKNITPKQALSLSILIHSANIETSAFIHEFGVEGSLEGILMSSPLGNFITTIGVGARYIVPCRSISYDELISMLEQEIKSKSIN